MKAIVTKKHVLKNVLSASGIEMVGEYYYVIGDDSPFLYVLDKSFQLVKKEKLFDAEVKESGRISKKLKPDYEAMTFAMWNGKKKLFMFGSGSKEQREKLLVVNVATNTVKEFSLSRFYKYLRKKSNVSENDFNIEAAVSLNNQLYLFNRGTNTVFRLSENDFENFMKEDSDDIATLEYIKCKLPVMNDVQAGFSGAGVFENKIFFSASLERTTNWIDDGEVLGSYIGYIDPKEFKNHEPHCALIELDKKIFFGKVESLVITGQSGNTLHIAAVTDEDNGNSVLLEIALTI